MDSEEVHLPHLETFCKAAELSNFTGAGTALGLTMTLSRGPLLAACLSLLFFLNALSRVSGIAPLPAPTPPQPWNTWPLKYERAVISPDGKWIAVFGKERGKVTLYDRHLSKEVARFPSKEKEGIGMVITFTPDSKRLVGHCVCAINPNLRPGDSEPYKAQYEVYVFDAPTGKLLQRFNLLRYHGLDYRCYGVSNKVLVVSCREDPAAVYDLETGKHLGTFKGTHMTRHLALSRDGNWLLTADTENLLHVWDVRKLALVDKLYGHTSPVEAVAISDDGQWCASAARPRVWVFDRATRQEKARGTTHASFHASRMLFTPNGKTLVTVGKGRGCSLFVWDWQSSREQRGGDIPDPRTNRAAARALVNAKGENLRDACMLADGSVMTFDWKCIRIWDLEPPASPEPPAGPAKKE
jgi:WD40 repeat protein